LGDGTAIGRAPGGLGDVPSPLEVEYANAAPGGVPGRSHTYRFDRFVLDPRTRRLLRDGEEKHLSPKAFDLMTCLVENRARAMSRAALLQRVWPSTFVEDTNLASLVAEIRRVLDDSADDPRFVRTVHRFGYWFIGNVQEGDAGDVPGKAPIRYWLIWETRQIPIAEGDHVVGRSPDADVWIDAAGVSRHHARVTLKGAEATVEDLGSKNGTFVRGSRITTRHPLIDADQIRFGPVVVTFRIPPPAGSTETANSKADATGSRRATGRTG
jgi:DNA-binding winged helix-turn-helix (wHTH) protein